MKRNLESSDCSTEPASKMTKEEQTCEITPVYTITPIKLQVEAYNKNKILPQMCFCKEWHMDAPRNPAEAEKLGISFDDYVKMNEPEFEITSTHSGIRVCRGCLFGDRLNPKYGRFEIRCKKLEHLGERRNVGDAYDNWTSIKKHGCSEKAIERLLTTQNIESQLANGNPDVPIWF